MKITINHVVALWIVLFVGVGAMGTEPFRLTTDGKEKLAPVFINNGDEVVFASHEVPNLVAIVALRLTDHSRCRLHPTVVNHQFDPAFSRDGRYHAFGRSSTSPQMVLVIEDTQEKRNAVFKPRESRATAESLVRRRWLADCFQPFRHRRSADRLGQYAGRGLEISDKGGRNERLADVFTRWAEDRVRLEPRRRL